MPVPAAIAPVAVHLSNQASGGDIASRLQAVLGLVLMIALCWVFRERKPGQRFPWRIVITGVTAQLVFAALWMAPVIGVIWACRSLELPKRLGERWLFIPALVPLPCAAVFYWATRPKRLSGAFRGCLLSRGYGKA